MVNKVTLIGRLGADPEVKYLETGVAVIRIGLATSENYKGKDGNWVEQTEWHDVVAWRDLAERIGKNAKKGHLLYVEGKLTTRTWQDKDGNNRRTTEVVANMARSLEKREPNPNAMASHAPIEHAPPPVSDDENLPF